MPSPLPPVPPQVTDDLSLLMASVRTGFVERTWFAVTLVCAVAVVGIPLRSLYLARPMNFGIALATGVAFFGLVIFSLRRRLPNWAYETIPTGIVLSGAVIAIFTLGLQGNGITYFIVGNTMVAMLFAHRLVSGTFIVSSLLLVLAAICFISGLLPVRLAADYAANPVVWIYNIAAVVVLSYSIVIGITAHRDSLQRLTSEVTRQNAEIARLANHDPLTGLPSLRLARDRMDMACSQSSRSGKPAAVLFIDLDGFKAINDTHGHDAGDQVLRVVADRLRERIRGSDTASRQGGDEFLVILNEINEAADAAQIGEKIVSSVSAPIPYGEQTLHVGASVGIALYPDHGSTPDELMMAADKAMYAVKRSGKNAYALSSGAT